MFPVKPTLSLASRRQRKTDSEAKNVQRAFKSGMRHVYRVRSPEMAGYAIVAWDMAGGISSSYYAARGPVGPGMLPAVVHDVLVKDMAIDQVEKL